MVKSGEEGLPCEGRRFGVEENESVVSHKVVN